MATAERTIKVRFDGSARGLTKATKAGERALASFERQAEQVRTKLGKLSDTATDVTGKLASTISGALSGLPPQVQAAVLAAAAVIGAALATALGAAIVSGVLLAVGGGVLAAGILAAAKDPKVAGAWKAFGDRAKTALQGFAEPFKEPLIRAASTFGDAFERMAPTIDAMGATLAPVIDKLAPALAAMAERALPGIQRAAEASVPLFDKLAEHAPAIGEAIAKFFDAIVKGLPGAIKFLDLFLKALIVVLPAVGSLLAWLSDQFLNSYATAVFVFDGVTKGAKQLKDGVTSSFNSVVSFVQGMPGRISSAASGMWDGLWQSFRGTANRIIGAWNRLSFTVGGGSIFGQNIPSFTLNTPDIPTFHQGGIVPGDGDRLVMAKGGEGVFTKEQMQALGGLGDIEVLVFIGDQELKGIVRTEIRESNRGLKRAVLAGAGAR